MNPPDLFLININITKSLKYQMNFFGCTLQPDSMVEETIYHGWCCEYIKKIINLFTKY